MLRYVLLALLLTGGAHAQPAPGSGDTPHLHRAMGMGDGPARPGQRPVTEAGQSAFAAIQDVVQALEADEHTDWSKVDIDSLRRHLIDMDEVTLRATVTRETLPNGLKMALTGQGRTLEAIRRMVPDQARQIDGTGGMAAGTAMLPDGVALTVTSANPAVVTRIRGLGFIGIMVLGGHHQAHHLAIARGEGMPHH